MYNIYAKYPLFFNHIHMNTSYSNLFIALILLAFILLKAQSKPHLTKNIDSGTIADSAMVVSAHPLASAVGIQILKKGGNAIDAAIAVQFALAVVYPEAGNIGGGGFMVYRAADGSSNSLDFRETAPMAATKDMYLDNLGNVIADRSTKGHWASGIPGTVAGAVAAHQKYGKLPWADVVQPAIELAQNGFVIGSSLAQSLNKEQSDLNQLNTRSCCLLKQGLWQANDTLKQTQLAATFIAIRDKQQAGFYAGWVADSLIAEMQRGGGLITHLDLANYKPVWRNPIVGKYKRLTFVSMPPPSSGGIALAQLCWVLEKYPLAKWGFQSPQTIHYIVEAERRIYADRATHLGDPAFWQVPVATLLNKNYLQKRMKNIDAKHATPSSKITAGKISNSHAIGHEETTHLSVVDKWGNAVAVTTTLNGAYGAKVMVGGAGFLLNNQMDDFSAKPGVPNLYGLVGNKANAIAPNKRMLSSMTPTIVEQNGKLRMVVGTPGGSTIITSVLQVLLNVEDFGMTMQQAVDAPRFHHQWLPDLIFIEKDGLDSLTIQQLEQMGHTIKQREPIGRVDAILIRKDGKLEGGADKRGEDAALGY